MKYNKGDRFVIEIKRIHQFSGLYEIEGLNTLITEGTLDKLADQNYGEKYLESITGIANESYDHGLEDAWKIATMIYKSSYYGGLKGFEVKKYFGCTIDEIYKLPIQDVVKGFKHYEEDQNLDWSRVPVDTPILVRDHDEGKWMCRHFAKYEDGKVYTWKFGGTSYTSHKDDVVEWKQAKLLEE